MAYDTANSYARPRRRRRKRKSHYGVLVLVIVLLIALIALAVKLVTTAVSAAFSKSGSHEIVYQEDNALGYCDGTLRERPPATAAAICLHRSSRFATSSSST